MTNRLHLGCGDEYKPGFVNIDKYDSSVADVVHDISDLPFENDSVDEIEADHVIEHFDYIHCKYVLCEWFRVLRPGGRLVLETPDLKGAMKSLLSADMDSKIGKIQWVYGIDSPGLLHKSGFTFDLLSNLLHETGFENITREDQLTHTYEAGMRVTCTRCLQSSRYGFNAKFRKELLRQLGGDDSFILIPIEDHLKPITAGFDTTATGDIRSLDSALAKVAACGPIIGVAFLDTCLKWALIDEELAGKRRRCLSDLVESLYVGRAFTLWTKSRKEKDMSAEFQKFMTRLETSLLRIFQEKSSFSEELQYLLSLDPGPVKILDFNLAMVEARKMFSVGVKLFHQQRLEEARDALETSVRINSTNTLAYWNLGRIESLLGAPKHKVTAFYNDALSLASRNTKGAISAELKQYHEGGPQGWSGPVAEH